MIAGFPGGAVICAVVEVEGVEVGEMALEAG